jgi:hypothetical protein
VADVGIDEVIAEVLPSDKADVIARLQAERRIVAMIDDGGNDAPALAQADLRLAIGTGTDVAIEPSDLTLVSGDLRAAADAVRLSRPRCAPSSRTWAGRSATGQGRADSLGGARSPRPNERDLRAADPRRRDRARHGPPRRPRHRGRLRDRMKRRRSLYADVVKRLVDEASCPGPSRSAKPST